MLLSLYSSKIGSCRKRQEPSSQVSTILVHDHLPGLSVFRHSVLTLHSKQNSEHELYVAVISSSNLQKSLQPCPPKPASVDSFSRLYRRHPQVCIIGIVALIYIYVYMCILGFDPTIVPVPKKVFL